MAKHCRILTPVEDLHPTGLSPPFHSTMPSLFLFALSRHGVTTYWTVSPDGGLIYGRVHHDASRTTLTADFAGAWYASRPVACGERPFGIAADVASRCQRLPNTTTLPHLPWGFADWRAAGTVAWRPADNAARNALRLPSIYLPLFSHWWDAV